MSHVIFDALMPYEYRQGEQTRTGWTEIGVAFPSRDGKGFNLEIRPGLAISGRVVIRPRRTGNAEKPAADAASTDGGPPPRVVYRGPLDLEHPLEDLT